MADTWLDSNNAPVFDNAHPRIMYTGLLGMRLGEEPVI